MPVITEPLEFPVRATYEYRLSLRREDLGNGKVSKRDNYVLEVKPFGAPKRDYKNIESLNNNMDRASMIRLLRDRFDFTESQASQILSRVEDGPATDPKKISDAPNLGRPGLPTRQFAERF